MSGERKEKEKQRLRQYLNPVLRGPNTDAVLESLSGGPCHLIQNLEVISSHSPTK